MFFTISHIEVNKLNDPISEQIIERENISHSAIKISSERVEHMSSQTSVMLPNDRRQPYVEEVFEVSNDVNKIVCKTNDNIHNVEHELKAEDYGRFHLFPCAINGLNEISRQLKISPLVSFQFRILDRRQKWNGSRHTFVFKKFKMVCCISANSSILITCTNTMPWSTSLL